MNNHDYGTPDYETPDHSPASFDEDLEHWIRGAGRWIRPNEDFRGNVLEAVRVGVDQKNRWRRWLASASLAASFLTAMMFAVGMLLSTVPHGVTADELFDRADRHARITHQTTASGWVESGTGLQWALCDVFDTWRRPNQ